MSEKASRAITPGQLVMIVGSSHKDSPVIGMCGIAKFVLEAGQKYKGFAISDSAVGCWVVEGDGLVVRNIRTWNSTGKVEETWVKDGYSLCRPEHLLPINPEADPLDVTETETLENPA